MKTKREKARFHADLRRNRREASKILNIEEPQIHPLDVQPIVITDIEEHKRVYGSFESNSR